MKKSKTTPERLLMVAETAEHLNVSEKSVYRLIKARKLAVIRCGRAFRIHPVDLENFINANRS